MFIRSHPHWPVWRVLLPVGLGTALSLMGDTALYTVLPTHADTAGISLASVGIILSANRWIRLITNGTAGIAYDRWPRRWFFIVSLFLGALSTAMYALTRGFWPLLIGRLLWGVAWSGIWVGGNAIILDVTLREDRGRWTGLYQLSFYLGSTLGFPVGGVLTDWLGFHNALLVATGVTLAGAFLVPLMLPETRPARANVDVEVRPLRLVAPPVEFINRHHRDALISATMLYTVNRFVVAGIISATLGLLVQQRWGETHSSFGAGAPIGIATITGGLLGVSTFIAMVAAPVAGHWSDRIRNRWRVVAAGLLPGALGLVLLALGGPAVIMVGVFLSAVASGSNQSLATAMLGDLIANERRGRALGWMHTFGDFSSAIAPPLAYALLAWIGLSGIYLVCAILLAGMLVWALRLAQANSLSESQTVP